MTVQKTTKPMTERERIALHDIFGWGSSPYIWKQGSMKRLEARGYVRRTGREYGGSPAWEITEEGRSAHG